ncbi:LytTR family transcriptional regulator DNA-binding domain-containing protein [Planktotalea sp.]|uniref:LytTR family transcriptional regulator DNA-binding domain-containing protein n=1 Tax=Planktotalea sp. TaxID=2029877 RepID=UPI00344E210B
MFPPFASFNPLKQSPSGHRFSTEIVWCRSASKKNELNVTTLTGKTSTSATFAETVETLGVGLGMRINSTSWIAFNAILSMVPIDNNRIEIKMTNGDRLMVPKFRKHSFEQTYQLFRKAA